MTATTIAQDVSQIYKYLLGNVEVVELMPVLAQRELRLSTLLCHFGIGKGRGKEVKEKKEWLDPPLRRRPGVSCAAG